MNTALIDLANSHELEIEQMDTNRNKMRNEMQELEIKLELSMCHAKQLENCTKESELKLENERIDEENAQSGQEIGDSKTASRFNALEQEKAEMASRFELLKEELKNVKEKLREKEEKLTEDGKAHSLKVVKFAMNANYYVNFVLYFPSIRFSPNSWMGLIIN
jgi:hypothetical protein